MGDSGLDAEYLTTEQLSYAAIDATVLFWLLRYLATARWLAEQDGFLMDDKVEKLVHALSNEFACPEFQTDIGPTSGFFPSQKNWYGKGSVKKEPVASAISLRNVAIIMLVP